MDPEKLDQYGRILLHGTGHDRWFDKSFTLCIGNNGRVSNIIDNIKSVHYNVTIIKCIILFFRRDSMLNIRGKFLI